MSSFVERKIELAVQLAQNTQTNQPNKFSESGTNTVTIKGLRTTVRIQNSGTPASCSAQVSVFGLSASLMNQLSTLGLVFNIVPKNVLTITAGDDERGMSTVFSGTIWAAYGDYSAQPNVPFQFDCNSGGFGQVAPAPVSSFTGKTSVETIMSGLARQLNYGFKNSGVSVSLTSPYFTGGLLDQARKCAEHAGIEYAILNGNMLEIWPRGGARNTPNIPVISKATGMIGSPAFTQQGIIVKTLFNPLISFGSLIKVESSVLTGLAGAQPAPGGIKFPSQWAVNKLDLALDALAPKGEWQSTVYAYNPNFAKTIIAPGSGGTGITGA